MKKKIILIVVGILALAASVFAIVKFSSNNDNNEIIEEQNQEVAVPLFYGESTVPVLSNVPADISFNISLVEGAEPDYELFDENGRSVGERTKETETGYIINAPKDGYEQGQTYRLVLGVGNRFETEEYTKYQALDFVIDRDEIETYTYADNVKEDNSIIAIDDYTVNLANANYQPGDIIISDNNGDSKAMKIISVDDNGNAKYVTPSIIEMFEQLDIHETVNFAPSEEYLNALNESLNNDEVINNAIVNLFFETIKAEDRSAEADKIKPSIEFQYDTEKNELKIEISVKYENSKTHEEYKGTITVTKKISVDFDAKLNGTQKYISAKSTTTTKASFSINFITNNASLSDFINVFNEELKEHRKLCECEAFELARIGPVALFLEPGIELKVSLSGEFEIGGFAKTKNTKGVILRFDEDGSYESETISDDNDKKSTEFELSLKAECKFVGSVGFPSEFGFCFAPDPKVLKVGIKAEPKIAVEIAGGIEGSNKNTSTMFYNGSLDVYFECPFSLFVKFEKVKNIFDDLIGKPLDDSSVEFIHTFYSPKWMILTIGTKDYIQDITSVDCVLLENGIVVNKVHTLTVDLTESSYIKENETTDFNNLKVYVKKINEKDYIECKQTSLNLSFYSFDFETNCEYDVKFVYRVSLFQYEEIVMKASYDKKDIIYFDCMGGALPNNEVSLQYNAKEGLSSLPTPTWFMHEFVGWYVQDDETKAVITEILPSEKTGGNTLVLCAKWRLKDLSVTLHIDEHTTEEISVKYGEKVDLIPKKEGYVFIGWGSAPNLPKLQCCIGPIITEDVNLYANFEPKNYNVTFINENNTTVETVKYGETVTAPDPGTIAGYRFAGWRVDYISGGIFDFSTPIKDDVMLVAFWQPVVTISFNTNGGTPIQSRTVDSGAIVNDIPVKEGNTFEGWYTDSNLKQRYKGGQITKDTTLYAKFVPFTYRVRFINDGSITDKTVEYGNAVSALNPGTKTGYNFICWCENDLTGKEFDFTTPIKKDITLVAKWEIKKIDVTFETNGGSAIAKRTVNYGTVISDTTSKTGYTFNGWYLDNQYKKSYTGTGLTANTTLYAKFTINSYKVTFTTNNGNPIDIYVEYGKTTEPLNPGTRTGYDFVRWAVGSASGPDFTNQTVITGTTSVIGVWQKQTFKVQYRTSDDELISEETVEYGTVLTKTHSKTGHTFNGWYFDKQFNQKYNGTAITSATTLYAKFTINAYKVTFSNNGNYTDIYVNYGQTTEPLNPGTRVGYDFVRWAVGSASGPDFTNQTVITGTTSVIGVWQKQTFNIEYYIDGTKVKTNTLDYGAKETAYNPGSNYSVWYMDSDYTTQFNFNTEIKKNYKLYCYNTHIQLTLYPMNGGSTSNLTVVIGNTYSALPTPSCSYYHFLGWYTSETGGTKIENTRIVRLGDCTTLFAHWEQNAVSDWVLKSNMPSGAQVVQTKWKYTERAYGESPSYPSYGMVYDNYMKTTSTSYVDYIDAWPSGYNSSDQYRSSMRVTAYSNSNNGNEQITYENLGLTRYIVYNWLYYPYTETYVSPTNGGNYIWGSYLTSDTTAVGTKYKTISGVDAYYTTVGNELGTSRIAFRIPVYRQKKTVKQKYYKFYIDTPKESSTQVYESSTIIGVEEWVKYRPK